jgi:hypothetical protein
VPVHQELIEKYAECKKIYEKPALHKGVPFLSVFEIIPCDRPLPIQ